MQLRTEKSIFLADLWCIPAVDDPEASFSVSAHAAALSPGPPARRGPSDARAWMAMNVPSPSGGRQLSRQHSSGDAGGYRGCARLLQYHMEHL